MADDGLPVYSNNTIGRIALRVREAFRRRREQLLQMEVKEPLEQVDVHVDMLHSNSNTNPLANQGSSALLNNNTLGRDSTSTFGLGMQPNAATDTVSDDFGPSAFRGSGSTFFKEQDDLVQAAQEVIDAEDGVENARHHRGSTPTMANPLFSENGKALDGTNVDEAVILAERERLIARRKRIRMMVGTGLFLFVLLLVAIFASTGSEKPTDPGISVPVPSPDCKKSIKVHPDFPKIGEWACDPLDNFLPHAVEVAKDNMRKSINPPDSARGSSIAALENTCPDYEYVWARDQARVFGVLLSDYKSSEPGEEREELEALMFDYAEHAHTIFAKNNAISEWTLAEAHYNKDGTRYTNSGWCNPQLDGPALRALVLMEFATAYIDFHGQEAISGKVAEVLYGIDISSSDTKSPIKRDLMFLVGNWNANPSCEPWEEKTGKHFFNKLIARRAFATGAKFARKVGDASAAETLESMIPLTEPEIVKHWHGNEGTLYSEEDNNGNRKDDVQTSLAIIYTHRDDDEFFSLTDDRSLANIHYTLRAFSEYPSFAINELGWANDFELGPAIGRYTFDFYGGGCLLPEEVCPGFGNTKSCTGQAWFVATNGMAEYLYKLARVYINQDAVTITEVNRAFFEFLGAKCLILEHSAGLPATFTSHSDIIRFSQLITLIVHFADSLLKRTKFHTDSTFRLDEQFNGLTGVQHSAKHLAWSYASLITATQAREQLNPTKLIQDYTHDGEYIQVHIIATQVPISVQRLRLTGYTASLGSGDPCQGKEMHIRRTVHGVNAEWSTFIQIRKNSQVDLGLRLASVEHGDGCVNPIIAAAPAVTFTASDKNIVEPIYLPWCNGRDDPTPGCSIPDTVQVTLSLVGAPESEYPDGFGIAGAISDLGEWRPCDGVKATKAGNRWVVTLPMKSKSKTLYKWVGFRGTNCEFERTDDRPIGPFYTQPATIPNLWACRENCVIGDSPTASPSRQPEPNTPTASPEQLSSSYQVTVRVSGLTNQKHARLLGNSDEMGQWTCDQTTVSCQVVGNACDMVFRLPPNTGYKFKLQVTSNQSDSCPNFSWVQNADRIFDVTTSDVVIDYLVQL